MICLKLVWITNHVAKQTMGTGFETRAASHNVEGNNNTLITPELMYRHAVSKQPFLKFSLVFQGEFFYKLTPRK